MEVPLNREDIYGRYSHADQVILAGRVMGEPHDRIRVQVGSILVGNGTVPPIPFVGQPATDHTSLTGLLTANQHSIAVITGLQTALDTFTDHLIDALGAHAATAISTTPAGNLAAVNVQTSLAELDSEKAATTHTHVSASVTDLTEQVQDMVAAMFAGGVQTNFTVVYDDTTGVLSCTGSAGSGGLSVGGLRVATLALVVYDHEKFQITAGATATLPTTDAAGKLRYISNRESSAGVLTVLAGSGDTLWGGGVLASGESWSGIFDGTSYWDRA